MRPPESILSITMSREGGDAVMALSGELDLHTTAQLRDHLAGLDHDAGLQLVVDLAGLQFIDSSGFGALIGEFARIQRGGGDMVLRAVPPPVRRTLEVMGLERALPISD